MFYVVSSLKHESICSRHHSKAPPIISRLKSESSVITVSLLSEKKGTSKWVSEGKFVSA
jgi:hypothetical protein